MAACTGLGWLLAAVIHVLGHPYQHFTAVPAETTPKPPKRTAAADWNLRSGPADRRLRPGVPAHLGQGAEQRNSKATWLRKNTNKGSGAHAPALARVRACRRCHRKEKGRLAPVSVRTPFALCFQFLISLLSQEFVKYSLHETLFQSSPSK
jgi:hypothetical protein